MSYQEKYAAAWAAFVWPEWVPESVRREILNFWSPNSCRGPAEWLENNRQVYNYAPPLGTRTVKHALSSSRRSVCLVEGRYVHAWNNIGWVVTDDGEAVRVSSGPRDVDATALAAHAVQQYEALGHS